MAAGRPNEGQAMSPLKRTARMALALGVLSLFAIGGSVFALEDIARGGEDLTMGWAVLRVSALIILMFIAVALVTLWRLLRLPHDMTEG